MISNRHSRIPYFIITILIMVAATGCLNRRKTSADTLSDKTVNLLLTRALPLGDPDSMLRQETIQLGSWLKGVLRTHPETEFQFDSGSSAITGSTQSRQVSDSLLTRLRRLNTFFAVNAAVPRKYFESDTMRELILAPASVNRIKELIATSQGNTMSETGGLVGLNMNDGHAVFLEVVPENEIMARRLNELRDDWMASRDYLETIEPRLQFLPVRTQRVMDSLNGDQPETEKLRDLHRYLELFNFYSQYSYILGHGEQYEVIAERGFEGIYAGVFHVHPQENTPSPEDRMGSILQKNVVIVPYPDGFDVHYLFYGEDPGREPAVFRYREK